MNTVREDRDCVKALFAASAVNSWYGAFVNVVTCGRWEGPPDSLGDTVFHSRNHGADLICAEEVNCGKSEAEVEHGKAEVDTQRIPPVRFYQGFQSPGDSCG